jgi:two-component system chemotaxis sensor kinase CheA
MEPKKTTAKTILFLDDDPFMIDVYSIKIGERGHTVVPVLDAKKALQKLRDGLKPDVIAFDIRMPGMDGFAFAEALRKEHLADGIPLVVLSNQSEPEDFARMKSFGVAAQFIKAHMLPDEMVTQFEKVIEKGAPPQVLVQFAEPKL